MVCDRPINMPIDDPPPSPVVSKLMPHVTLNSMPDHKGLS
jgi:hypothetical protein